MERKITIEELKKSDAKKQTKKKYKKNAFEYIDFESEKQKDPKYKTEICSAFQENGFCPYGNRCRFAHGKNELFNKDINHPNYKKKDCLSFNLYGFCNYGLRCHFKHGIEFPKLHRSFFQLILMMYVYDNLNIEELKNYFNCDLGISNSTLQDKNEGENNSNFYSPEKKKILYFPDNTAQNNKSENFLEENFKENGEKNYIFKSYKNNNSETQSIKKNSKLLYKKRLSIFQNINQLEFIRKSFNFKSYHSIFGNPINDNNLIKSPLNNNKLNNDAVISDKIYKNFNLVLNDLKFKKMFIPKDYRKIENNSFKNEQALKEKADDQIKVKQNSMESTFFNNDNLAYDSNYTQNLNKFVNGEKENHSFCLDISKVSTYNNSKLNVQSNNNTFLKNDVNKECLYSGEKSIKSFYSFENGFSNEKITYNQTHNINENLFANLNQEFNDYKNGIVNSDKGFRFINMLESNNFNPLKKTCNNRISNNKDLKFNSYQKVVNINYCKFEDKSYIFNKNLDFSLSEYTTNNDNLGNFYNENMSNIEKYEYKCISPKSSFDLNEDPSATSKFLFNDDGKLIQ